VIIDAASAFAHGQVYVALSRCRTLDGLFLTSMLSPRVLIKDGSVTEFMNTAEQQQPDNRRLEQAAVAYRQTLLHELFDFSLLKNRAGRLLYLFNENRALLIPEVVESFGAMDAVIASEMVAVAAKFTMQIDWLLSQNPDITTNAPLQDRVIKACGYFAERLQPQVAPTALMHEQLDIDNKEIRKALHDALRRFREELLRKTACIDSCKNGFSLAAYLDARARGSIEKPEEKKRRRAVRTEGDEEHALSEDNALVVRLKAWRRRTADEADVPAFMILHQKTLLQIASVMPSSEKTLAAIKGMGKKTVARFGDEILRVISEYCAENNIPLPPDPEPTGEVDALPPKVKVDTRQVTFDLVMSGKALVEIAAERGLTLNTIEGHIADFIRKGTVGIDRFMPPGKVLKIRDHFLAQENRGLTAAKNHFGEECSYGELKMVLAHMEFEGPG
jgi:hypothetical protein